MSKNNKDVRPFGLRDKVGYMFGDFRMLWDKAAADKWLNVIINDKDAPAVVSATAQSLR